jgi:hypothetical protein
MTILYLNMHILCRTFVYIMFKKCHEHVKIVDKKIKQFFGGIKTSSF